MTDLHRYSQVYPQVSMLRSRNKHIFHIQILQRTGTTLSHKYYTTIGLRLCHLHGLLLLLGPFGLILKELVGFGVFRRNSSCQHGVYRIWHHC